MSSRLTDERLLKIAAMPAAARCLTLTIDETHALAAELILTRAVVEAARRYAGDTGLHHDAPLWDAINAYDEALTP